MQSSADPAQERGANAREGRRSVGAILKSTRDAGSGPHLHVYEIIHALGDASFGPLILVPALVVVTPLSGIPGVSSVCGLCIVLMAAQWQFHREHVWLPQWLMRRQVSRSRFARAVDALEKPVRLLDRLTHPRLALFVSRPFMILIELLCLLCGLVMPALEFIPFSSSIMAAAVVLLTVATITRDGAIAALGLLAVVAGIAAIIFIVSMM